MMKMFNRSELTIFDTETQSKQILLLKKKILPVDLLNRVATNVKFVKYEIHVTHIKMKYACKCTGASKLY